MRRLVPVLVAAMLFGAVTLAGLQPAQAWVGTCSSFTDYQKSRGWAYCEGGGTGKFRYWIHCKVFWIDNFGWGPWCDAGGSLSSSASCVGKVVESGVEKLDETAT